MVVNRIRDLREEKHISQTRLSIDLEVSQETISAYEVGKHYPSVKSLLKLREIFGVSIDYLLGLSDQRTVPIQKSSLSDSEYALLQDYRQLDEMGKARLRAYLDGFLDRTVK